MKPKTKIQIKVTRLSRTLSKLSKVQKEWSFKNCLDKFAVRSRNKLFCMECGHDWKDTFVLGTALLGCTCPLCGCNLIVKTTKEFNTKQTAYFAILSTREDMQVVRIFLAIKHMKKRQTPNLYVEEVMQHWVEQSGNVTTMSINVQGLSHYYDQWIYGSEMQVRPKSYQSCPRYGIVPYKVYPRMKTLSVIKRNGFRGDCFEFAPQHLLSLILKSKYVETLLKTNQIPLLTYFDSHPSHIKDHWSSIKIAIRNNYTVSDASIWIDYLDLLKTFGKDLHNPKYVCPIDLRASHDRYLNKKRERDRKIHFEQLKEQIEKDQKEFEKQKGRFFNIHCADGEIFIKTLDSIEEYLTEGDMLEHCVFRNQYYKREDSLILSARINNRPVETIEISLNNLSIIQARGLHNNPTEYHEKIINMVNSNIIQQIAKCV